MNREDIIEMWKHSGGVEIIGMPFSKIEAFAALVASAEREACAKVCEEHGKTWEEKMLLGFQATLDDAAKAIRARGQA